MCSKAGNAIEHILYNLLDNSNLIMQPNQPKALPYAPISLFQSFPLQTAFA